MARHPHSGDLFVLNHLEYDADTLANEYWRDQKAGLATAMPQDYFPNNDPSATPVNFWRPYAFLLLSNWINDLYQATPFDLTSLGDS
jgi:homoserine O-succinyltransferase